MHRGLGFALDLGLGLWKRFHEALQVGNHGMKDESAAPDPGRASTPELQNLKRKSLSANVRISLGGRWQVFSFYYPLSVEDEIFTIENNRGEFKKT